ncbi:hypothetical protein PBI_ALSFRO_43 [Mycobacterium phage Alsfro]|uniref:hypothetical protein n=1 Tax=Mycobacterium phage Alsfro TaxID=1458724 RepID=UPI00042F4C2B|nr:hypothetical protein PBI_ALSFRO_43 [Mycobacterium phage Alsfro]AHK12094.1 hypothetical protein PBI_ALSFRO_43 [Mycobacterium phage Alsfro]
MAKAENSITVKVIPVILTPDEVRQKIVDVISDWVTIYSCDAEQVAAEILSGVTLVQVGDVEEKPEPRVWEKIQDVPEDVVVRDSNSDIWFWAGRELYHEASGAPWGWASSTRYAKSGPFTKVIAGPFTEVVE